MPRTGRRCRSWVALVGLLALGSAGAPALALQPDAAGAAARPGSFSPQGLAIADLGGALVAALAAEGELWLLVRPPAEPDGPRRLLRLRAGADAIAVAAVAELPGWVKTLAATDLGDGPELLAGGLGEIATLGPLAAPRGEPRRLFAAPDVDLRSLSPAPLRRGVEPWLAVASAGRVRVLRGGGGALREVFSARTPVRAAAEGGGLRLAGPPAAALDREPGRLPLLVLGPEPRGRTRLRTTLLDPETGGAGGAEEAWSRLPGPERVEDHRVLALDGEPWLVVRAQGSETVNALERQRLRVLPLRPDRTRAGTAPTFTAEVDSRRWHGVRFAAADRDGDGRDDLLVLRPEGLRGNALVVEVYRGLGGGRFAARSWRADLPGPFALYALEEQAREPGALPALVTIAGRRLEVRDLRPGDRGAVVGAPRATATLPPAPGEAPPAAASESELEEDGPAGASPDGGGDDERLAVLGIVALGPGEGEGPRRLVVAVDGPRNGAARLYLVRER